MGIEIEEKNFHLKKINENEINKIIKKTNYLKFKILKNPLLINYYFNLRITPKILYGGEVFEIKEKNLNLININFKKNIKIPISSNNKKINLEFDNYSPKQKLQIRRIIFIQKLFNQDKDLYYKLFLKENKKIKKIYEKEFKLLNLIEKNLDEIEKNEIFFKFDKKELKKKLKGLIRLKEKENLLKKEEIEKYLLQKFTLKEKKPFYIKYSNNLTKYSIQFRLNHIKPIYMIKENENCNLCPKNHKLNFEGTLECENKYSEKDFYYFKKKFFNIKLF